MYDYSATPEVIPSVVDGMYTLPQKAAPTLNDSTAMFLGLGIMGFVAFIIIISIVATIIWIWSIIHIAKNENFKDDNQRIIWLLIVIFTGIFGSIVYFFAKPKN